MNIQLREDKNIDQIQILSLYTANQWSSASKPDLLFNALIHSHGLITAWSESQLVGLGNALSDGYLVVYYAHLLVHPEYQGKGIGRMIMHKFGEKYENFHQQILVADVKAIDFYKKCGFVRAGETAPMWIYQGTDHA
jgi:GNAT superfamily N-acetyltransferase